MGEMTAGSEIQSHEGVAGLQQGHEDCLVSLRARMRLDIGKAAVEDLLGALNRQRLGNVDELAAAIVTPAGISCGILVREYRALRFKYRSADDVFRSNQFNLLPLTVQFLGNRAENLRIGLGEAAFEESGMGHGGLGCSAGHRLLRQKLIGRTRPAWRPGVHDGRPRKVFQGKPSGSPWLYRRRSAGRPMQ